MQNLDGWREWIAQIAVNAVQPPVSVTTTALAADDGTGYLLVHVPASSDAPHMATGRYYGRSDTTNRVLPDHEVRQLWERHHRRRDRAHDLLRAEIDRDPTGPDLRANAHLCLVAQPQSTHRTLLLDAVPDRNLRPWVSSLEVRGSYSPSGGIANTMSRRAWGVGRSSYEIGPDRKLRPNGDHPPKENNLWDLEVREDGGIRLFNARASDTSRGPAGLFVALIVGECGNVVDLARRVSQLADFHGSWTFGIGVAGLRSQSAHTRDFRSVYDPYSEDEYLEVHEANHHELFKAGSPIIDALLGRFCRAVMPDCDTAGLDPYPQRPSDGASE